MKKVVGFILFAILLFSSASAELAVHFLDVGHGDCAIIQADGHSMVIDGGSPGKSDLLFSSLSNLGITTIDAIVATHPDADHIGGLPAAFHAAKVNTLYVAVSEHDSDRHNTLIKTALEKGVEIRTPQDGEQFQLGDATVTFYVPIVENQSDNEFSIITLIEYKGRRFLFCADATQDMENILINDGYDIAADVLKVAHHGSDTASMMQFILAVNPQYAVISGNSRYSTPTDEVPTKILTANATLLHTLQNGTISMKTDGTPINIETTRSYYGNGNTLIFHYYNCPSVARMNESSKVLFYTREQAIHSGYISCLNCQP